MTELAELAAMGRDAWLTVFLVLLRVGAAMALFPAFGEQSVPARIRLVLALAFTAVVAPAVWYDAAPGLAFVTEPLAGLALGIMIRLFVMVLQMAGVMAAQSTSLAALLGGAGAEPMPAIGHILTIGGLALAVMSGLHIRIAEALILSYDIWPAGSLPDAGALMDWGVAGVARSFALAFSLAAPFVIAALIYNVALGVINRAMPQLMVAFVGAPAITAGGLILLLLTAPGLLALWLAAFHGILTDPFGMP